MDIKKSFPSHYENQFYMEGISWLMCWR